MTKSEFVSRVAKVAGLTKAQAEKAVNAFMEVVKESLSKGESITLVGFGTFEVVQRAGRKGRNPRTGEEIEIKPTKVPKFRPGKGLKEAVK